MPYHFCRRLFIQHLGGVLKLTFTLLATVLLALPFTASNPWLALAIVPLWGAVAVGNVSGLQLYVVCQAERRARARWEWPRG